VRNKKVLEILMQNILQNIEEGIHIVDENGRTIVYNSAMEEIEGLDAKQVIGNYLLDIFPSLTKETSTLLRALTTGKMTKEHKQSYLNLKGKKVSSINTTLPIRYNDEIIGAIEIAKNITNVSHLSEQIIELQQRLNRKNNNSNTLSTKKHYTFDNIIGQDRELLKAISFARGAANTSSSVLIYGETGTGKELFAQSIHYESPRKNNYFIAQNCAALPETLLEGILFGTSKGGFTGAVDRPGLFEQANGGTLFLDEINSMSLSLQAKLLRVLQEGYVRRVGGLKDIPIDVRIIAATNENPTELIDKGGLRKDLYYRINVININIPPLRKRKEDIPLLIDHFIRYYNNILNKDVWMMSKDLQEAFMTYSWPGNVRELQNFIEASMNMLIDDHVIKKEHLPPYAEDLMINNTSKKNSIEFGQIGKLNEYLDAIEKEIIFNCLRKNQDNITKTSRELGISRQNLQYKIKKYTSDK
jgi:arginine utilization regulatory protein